jgi:hypothetical protein
VTVVEMQMIFKSSLGLAAALFVALPSVAIAGGPVAHPTIEQAFRDRSASTASQPLFSVSQQSCTSASVRAARTYSVKASMFAVSGSSVMRLRFHLYEKLEGQTDREITPTGSLGGWESAKVRDGRHWTFVKRITGLSAPASYRMTANFEWISSRGRVLKSATAEVTRGASRVVCVQPDLRPDLSVAPSGVTTGFVPGTARIRFLVTVTNHGRGTAPGTIVQITIGASRGETRLGAVRAGSTATVTLYADRCPGGTALVEVDPGNTLEEPSTEDNRAVINCPIP